MTKTLKISLFIIAIIGVGQNLCAQSIIEHYNFVSEDTPLKVFYAFATNTDINDEFLDFFSRNEITFSASLRVFALSFFIFLLKEPGCKLQESFH